MVGKIPSVTVFKVESNIPTAACPGCPGSCASLVLFRERKDILGRFSALLGLSEACA